MTALSVTISGDSPDELAVRLHALAAALTRPTATPPATNGNGGGLPAVPSPAPRLCSVHNEQLRFDTWTAKSGKQCRAWRCSSATAATDCDIEWAS